MTPHAGPLRYRWSDLRAGQPPRTARLCACGCPQGHHQRREVARAVSYLACRCGACERFVDGVSEAAA